MSLEAIKPINIDFHDSKYILVNAKQYDRKSRFILATCYNNGVVFPLYKRFHYAYIRYRKADDLGVFNSCKITQDGKILIELTEQMLATVGKNYADLIIVENNPVTKNVPIITNTGELIISDNDSILSTMTFCVNVTETAFDNTEIESSYEYNALNDLLIKATEDYSYVIKMCKISEENAKLSETNAKDSELKAKTSEMNSAVSEANAKVSETNAKVSETNAKESEEKSKISETNANISETNAKESEEKSKISEENAKLSETNAKISETNIKESEANAKTSETNAKESETNASISETNSKESETNAQLSEANAKTSETNANNYANIATTKASEASQSAVESAENAQISSVKATESSNYATLSQSYAVGGTDTRTNEDSDNAKYYYSQTKYISDSMGGMFAPQGTIKFAELSSVDKAIGYVYHIEDAFVTDDTFKGGAGVSHPAGTNVYYTSDGYWDCFVGQVFAIDAFEKLNQTILELQERIKALEDQNVLEIVE